jgi:hypothetical protein
MIQMARSATFCEWDFAYALQDDRFVRSIPRGSGYGRRQETVDASKGIYRFRLQSQGTEVFQHVTLIPRG